MKLFYSIIIATILIHTFNSSVSGEVVLTFEDLPPAFPGYIIPNYAGLTWSSKYTQPEFSAYWLWGSELSRPDYSTPHSGNNYLINAFGFGGSRGSPGFALPHPDTDILCGAWFTQTNTTWTAGLVWFNGYDKDGNLIAQSKQLSLSSMPRYLAANFGPVAWITVEHDLYSPGTYYTLDDLTYIPEPAAPPVADAGPYQMVYAWFDGIAIVILDGTGSYDDDGQDLTYNWSWTIDGNDFTGSGPRPVIELPVGEHVIELIVNNGIDDSDPNHVTITVIEPIEVAMKLTPQALNLSSEGKWVKAHFVLPEGFIVEDVNSNTPAMLEPLGIESEYMNVFINEDGLVEIEAAFHRADLCAAGIDYGPAEVAVVGMLTSDQCFYGTDTIKIISNDLRCVAVFVSHWLEADCGAPGWCSGFDIDHSSTVNFVDFVMYDGCYFEVIEE